MAEPTIPKQTVIVAGLPVHIFTRTPLEEVAGDVAVLFFLHGRTGKATDMDRIVRGVFRRLAAKDHDDAAKELVVATFDQRNHGERLVNPVENDAWKEGNERHAIDMYAIQTGTSRDVSFLIDFLPSYIFPTGKARVAQWIVGGVSLGGHASWISLRHDPRITVGIPIIGCPDYLKLIKGRAEESGVVFGPPHIPGDLLAVIERDDPANAPFATDDSTNPFLGKKILVLSGGDDPVVPWRHSEDFVQRLVVGEHGVKKFIAYPGVGHTCTAEMVGEMATFLWENALVKN